MKGIIEGKHVSDRANQVVRMLRDSAPHREAMLETQIMARGVRDERVLDAMRRVPRELFVPEGLKDEAYDDRALPIGPGQTISQPYIVAYMTAQLDARPEHTVLEVGTGTGYQAAILAHLAGTVHTIECDANLSAKARERLAFLGISNVGYSVGDGSVGCPEAAPFDRIIVTAGCPEIPPAMLEQLARDGLAVLPVGPADTQTLLRVRKQARGTSETPLIPCRFVKLVGQQGWQYP